MTSILSVEDLHLLFDDGKTRALDGIDLSVKEGEFVAIAGPSGCGKSSLLSLIGTMEAPSSGRIRLRGEDYSGIEDFSLFRRKHIGFIFQSSHLIPTLTAFENVLVPALGWSGARMQTRARELLSLLGMEERTHHYPAEMSGGERQRVAIARALLNEPELVLADEPTASLDSKNALRVLEMLDSVRRERNLTMLMVTHDRDVASHADRIIHMKDGRIERTESPR